MIKKTRKKKEKSSLEIKVISFLFSSFLVFLIILLIVSNIKIHQRRIYLKSQMEEKEIEIERLMTNLQKLKEAGSIEEDYFIDWDDAWNFKEIIKIYGSKEIEPEIF